MKPGFLAPKGTAEKKPPHGAPCNSCGLCCVASLCPLARHVFHRSDYPSQGPCPALGWDAAGKSVCGLVATPARFSPVRAAMYGSDVLKNAARFLIGSGTGCDARFNGEPADEGFYRTLRAWDHRFRAEVRASKKVWGM